MKQQQEELTLVKIQKCTKEKKHTILGAKAEISKRLFFHVFSFFFRFYFFFNLIESAAALADNISHTPRGKSTGIAIPSVKRVYSRV